MSGRSSPATRASILIGALLLTAACDNAGVPLLRAWAPPHLGLSVYFWIRMGFSPLHGEGPEGGRRIGAGAGPGGGTGGGGAGAGPRLTARGTAGPGNRGPKVLQLMTERSGRTRSTRATVEANERGRR